MWKEGFHFFFNPVILGTVNDISANIELGRLLSHFSHFSYSKYSYNDYYGAISDFKNGSKFYYISRTFFANLL